MMLYLVRWAHSCGRHGVLGVFSTRDRAEREVERVEGRCELVDVTTLRLDEPHVDELP